MKKIHTFFQDKIQILKDFKNKQPKTRVEVAFYSACALSYFIMTYNNVIDFTKPIEVFEDCIGLDAYKQEFPFFCRTLSIIGFHTLVCLGIYVLNLLCYLNALFMDFPSLFTETAQYKIPHVFLATVLGSIPIFVIYKLYNKITDNKKKNDKIYSTSLSISFVIVSLLNTVRLLRLSYRRSHSIGFVYHIRFLVNKIINNHVFFMLLILCVALFVGFMTLTQNIANIFPQGNNYGQNNNSQRNFSNNGSQNLWQIPESNSFSRWN